MKKLLNISFFLFLLALLCSLSCQGWFAPKEAGESEPNLIEELDWSQAFEGGLSAQEELTALPQESMPTDYTITTSSTALVSVNELGSSVISRTYPWAECGMVRLDKIMPKEVGLNKPFNYTIKITNLMDAALSGIVVTEETPAHYKFINSNPTAKQENNKLIWVIDSLGAKATFPITISGMADYAEPLRNCTTVQTPVVPACVVVDVIEPRLKLTKTAPAEVLLCDLIPVKYIVSNAGTGSIPNVKIVDSLPPGLRTTDGRGELVFEAGTLGPGQAREFTIELRPTRTGTYTSKATATSPMGQKTESLETMTSVGLPVLSITKTGPEKLFIGRPVTYEITVTNKSDVPAKDTVVEDTIPEGMTSVKATAGAKLSDSKLLWEIGTLAPNTSEMLRISYTPTKPGMLVNDATASAYCAEPVTASVRTVVTGIPAVMLEVVDVEDPVRIGNRGTYMITVTNQGSASSRNIRISCILEDNVQYISSAGATAGSLTGDTVRFLPLGNLKPKEKAVWRIIFAAVKPGDVRFKVVMNSDELTRPVEETEATHLYE
ncbi:MAG: DUF11 domain-containing protein [Sedimentisphaerales bacterium]|nr:DUF11 domain-containing protein [Sedimentisphaerales bacterium]